MMYDLLGLLVSEMLIVPNCAATELESSDTSVQSTAGGGPLVPPLLVVPPVLVVPPLLVVPPVLLVPPVPIVPPLLVTPPVLTLPPVPCVPPLPSEIGSLARHAAAPATKTKVRITERIEPPGNNSVWGRD